MSDEKENKGGDQQLEEQKKGGLPIKAIAVVLLMLIGEGVGIVALMSIMGKPSNVAAVEMMGDPSADLGRIVEVPVLHEKFTNSKQGRVWIWDAEVIAQVKQLHSDSVAADIEGKQALIRTGMSRIMASAQQSYFNEPGLETLTRQMHEFLNDEDVIGTDPEGEPRVVEVLIPSCIGFPTDF